uniref:Uncharacterized protein n=1 Tax=viral metagenome TaxID=1070528 RepID=A0A6M3INK9_9ZZZZ
MSKPIWAFRDTDGNGIVGRKHLVCDWNGEDFYDISLPYDKEVIYLLDQDGIEYELSRR